MDEMRSIDCKLSLRFSAFIYALLLLWASSDGYSQPLTDEVHETVLDAFQEHGNPHPSSHFSGNKKAIAFGQRVFFSTVFSSNQTRSCASCHQPEREWTDGRSVAEGGSRNVPTLWNLRGKHWYFWDGRADSLWSQVLQVFENPAEHDVSRTRIAQLLCGGGELARGYRAIAGDCPVSLDQLGTLHPCATPTSDEVSCRRAWEQAPKAIREGVNAVFVSLGKMVAAFVETLTAQPSRFDALLGRLRAGQSYADVFNEQEFRGLEIFAGEGQCVLCHFGSDLSDGEFHDVRVLPANGAVEQGRYRGAELLLSDRFNLLSVYNDFPKTLVHTRYVKKKPEDWARFKTPTLRRVQHTEPYMHQGQLSTLEAVVDHYSTFENALEQPHHGEQFLTPLHLSAEDKAALVAFLRTL
jgi:cytochrome c peroxidase